MSEENVEIVRRVYEAVARRDTATVLAAYDPDVEWDLSRSLWGDLTGRAVYRGHDDLRAFYREWYEAWGRYEEAVEELIEAGEHVIVVATGRGRGHASGPRSGGRSTGSGRFERARSSGWRGSERARLPSKPPGCRSSTS
jgi:ketosteroid isomerase-like protein